MIISNLMLNKTRSKIGCLVVELEGNRNVFINIAIFDPHYDLFHPQKYVYSYKDRNTQLLSVFICVQKRLHFTVSIEKP